MALNINQFAQTPVQGQMDLQFAGSVISAQIDSAQVADIVAGQPLKMATTSGGVPKFIALAANTDRAFGFAARNLKDINYSASDAVEVALKDSVMYMTAGAAITRGASVEVVYTTNKVITSAGVNPIVGFALDTAAADGDLIRVYIITPSILGVTAADQTVVVTATLAEINAGKTLIAGQTGQAITVTNITARVTGTFTTGTAVLVQSSNGTPVIVETLAEAAIAGTGIVLPSTANVTLGAGWAVPLGTGDGLVVANSGANQAGGTSIKFTITYRQA